MKKVANYLGFAIVVLLMAAAVFTYQAPYFGWRVDAVSSGSMEPQLKVGSLVVTRPVEPEAIVVGDMITFRPITVGENPITHRVTGIGHSSSLHFQTKGDANYNPDPFTVPARDLIGKICFHVPYLGYVTKFLNTLWGFMCAVVIPGLIVIAVYVTNIWQALTMDNKKRADKVVRDEA